MLFFSHYEYKLAIETVMLAVYFVKIYIYLIYLSPSIILLKNYLKEFPFYINFIVFYFVFDFKFK